MLSPSLSRDLAGYGIGDTLRALRLRRKLGLVELGRHSGLSPAMLSKLERGRLFPTLPTLLRIAMVFGVGLDHFFGAVDADDGRWAWSGRRSASASRNGWAGARCCGSSSVSTSPPPNGG